MISILLLTSWLIMGGYILWILAQFIIWQKNPKPERVCVANSPNHRTQFTVVIAMRNELANLEKLINSIGAVNYPFECFELILVDDGSDDGSYETANELLANADYQYQIIKSIGIGKKEAIREGVKLANFPYLLFTDADCTVPIGWMNAYDSIICSSRAQFVIGYVAIKGNSFWSHLQTLEFMSIVASSISSAQLGYPTLCNGANMCVEKQSWLNSNLQDTVSSGDDVFMLHDIKRSGGKIEVANPKQCKVETRGVSLRSFFDQRIRWIKKPRLYSDLTTTSTAALVGGLNILLVIGLCLNLYADFPLNHLLILCSVKAAIDYIFLRQVAISTEAKPALNYFLIVFIGYPFYLLILAALAIFFTPKWKGRVIRTK